MPSSPKFFYPRPSFSSSSSRRSTVLIVSILLGIVGLFVIFAVSRQGSGYKCKYSKLRSVSVVWDKSDGGGGNGAVLDGDQKRYKVMGFVGIQTGFGSAGRRRSLRQTWYPNDRQGLQRVFLEIPTNRQAAIYVVKRGGVHHDEPARLSMAWSKGRTSGEDYISPFFVQW